MAEYELTAQLMEWYAAIFCALCFAWYAGSLLRPRFRWSFPATAAGYAAVRLLLPRLMPADGPETEPSVLRLLVVLGLSLILVWLFYTAQDRLLTYVCVSWAALYELAFFMSYTVVFAGDPLFEDISNALLEGRGGMTEETFMIRTWQAAILIQLGMAAALSLICFFSCRSIIRAFPRGQKCLSGPEFRLLILPAVVGLLMGILLRMLVIAVADGIPTLLFDRYPPLRFVVPAVALVAGAAVIYVVHTLKSMVELQAEQRRRLVVESQLQALRELVEDTERTNERVHRMRHDLRNTLTVIQALSEDVPEGEALRTYLDELNGDMQGLERPFRTGDPVADTLLAAKYEELQRSDPGAEFDTEDLVLTDIGAVSSYDLGIILGNALDNALRAVRQQKSGGKLIRLRAFCHDDLLFLNVENSLEEPPAAGRDGLPVSTKTESGHGVGLANIRTIAEKYDGTMDWKAKEGTFTLSVMLHSAPGHPAESQR